MSNRALTVIEEFNNLRKAEQIAVYEAIGRHVAPADYAPFSNDDLTAIAAERLALADPDGPKNL
jgi:hypothetical protein